MKSSGRNSPCPACGRTKDADCRWNDTTILCHTGTDLKPGQTIEVDGKAWAFIHHKGGYSGCAAVFKPDGYQGNSEWKHGLRRTTPNTPSELAALQETRHQWSEVFDQFFAAFDAAWNVPDFYTAHPDDLNAAFACIDDAQEKAVALTPHLSTIWREHPDLKQRHKLKVDDCLKVIAHMAEDSRVFQQNELGFPCPVAVSFIEEAL